MKNLLKLNFKAMLCTVLTLLSVMAAPVMAQSMTVDYIKADGAPQNTVAEQIDAATAALKELNGAGGWYAVSSEVNLPNRIEVEGNVNLILMDGATLTAPNGVCLKPGATLTIYGQSQQTGRLVAGNASDPNAAALGIDPEKANGATSVIKIDGAVVEAASKGNGAAIGAGVGNGPKDKTDTVRVIAEAGQVIATADSGVGVGIGTPDKNTKASFSLNGNAVVKSDGKLPINTGNLTAGLKRGLLFQNAAGEVFGDNVKLNGGQLTLKNNESVKIGKNASLDPATNISLEGNATVTAAVTLSPNGGEIVGTVPESYTYNPSQDTPLPDAKKEGKSFNGWVVSANQSGPGVYAIAKGSFNPVKYVASFEDFCSVVVKSQDDKGGTVSGGGSFKKGERAVIEAKPASSYVFKGWIKANDPNTIVSAEEKYSFNVQESIAYTALFEKKEYKLVYSVTPENAGQVTVTNVSVPDQTKTEERTYPAGTEVEITAAPATGYIFKGFRINGGDTGSQAIQRFSIDQDTEIVAVFELGNEEGDFIVNPPTDTDKSETASRYHIEVTSQNPEMGVVRGSGDYLPYQYATLKAIPNAGYAFKEWLEDGQAVSSSEEYTVYTNGNRSLVAVFVPEAEREKTYKLTLVASPTQGGSVSGTGSYAEGTTVRASATPSAGYKFSGWEMDGQVITNNPVYNITMKADATLTAKFVADGGSGNEGATPSQTYTVNLTSDPRNGGYLMGEGKYTQGQQVTVMAESSRNFEFRYWEEDGKVVSLSQNFSFNINRNRSLKAVFIEIFEIKASAEPAEAGRVTGAGKFYSGAAATLEAQPMAGYKFDYWTVNGDRVEGNDPIYEATVDGDKEVVAHFSKIAVESIDLSDEAVYLTTRFDGQTTKQMESDLQPDGAAGKVTWTADASRVVRVDENGLITALNPGVATVTASVGGIQKTVSVYVSNSDYVSDGLRLTSTTPDYFTVSAVNVRRNPAIENVEDHPVQVTMFTWSDLNQEDMDCKQAVSDRGVNWSYTFPVNDNGRNNHFWNASNINVHIYATDDVTDNGSLLGNCVYNYVNPGNTESNVAVTPYVQNIGFVKPTVMAGQIAGTPEMGLGLEGLRVASPLSGVDVTMRVHAEDLGWLTPEGEGVYNGTIDQNKQLEAVQLMLSGSNAKNHHIRYRVYVEGVGWSPWAMDGSIAGTTGQHRMIQGIQVELSAETGNAK